MASSLRRSVCVRLRSALSTTSEGSLRGPRRVSLQGLKESSRRQQQQHHHHHHNRCWPRRTTRTPAGAFVPAVYSITDGRRSITTTPSSSDEIHGRLRSISSRAASKGPNLLPGLSPSFKVSRVSYNGSMETVNLGTSELLKTASIYARDLFFTLNLTSRQERQQQGMTNRRTVSAIQPRKDVIVLSFGKVRAVVNHSNVLIFDAHNSAVRQFAQELRDVYRSGNLNGEPNELVFLEYVLRDTVDSFHRRLRLFEPIVEKFLEKVDNNDVTSPDAGVHQLVPLKDALQSFEIQVKQSLECLEDLLNNDSEMLALLLTEQKAADEAGGKVAFARHEHVEILLGVYARQISNITMEINYVLQRLQSKQEFVALALSGYRNRMIRMNVHLAIAGLGIGLSTAVAGFFGMNLVSGLEASPTAFNYTILCSTASSLVVSLGCLNLLSGRTMRQQDMQRLEEIETLTSALSDIPVVDHILQSTVERGQSLNKDEFGILLRKARLSRNPGSSEVDLLFHVLDKVKDGHLNDYDFPSTNSRDRNPTSK